MADSVPAESAPDAPAKPRRVRKSRAKRKSEAGGEADATAPTEAVEPGPPEPKRVRKSRAKPKAGVVTEALDVDVAAEAAPEPEPVVEAPAPEPIPEPEAWVAAVGRPRPKRAEPAGPPLWKSRPLLLGVVAAIVLTVVAVIGSLLWALPLNRALEPLASPTLVLVADNGQPIARRGSYKEAPIEVAKLPKVVPNAFVAIEDRRFYQHMGVDPLGILRALHRNAQAGEGVQGGSTITQQLAKNAFLTNKRTLKRKLQEALIALYLETRLSKDEILSRYLSSVYFGDSAFGLRSASQRYFAKPPEQLSLGEAAMLAGLVKAPSRLAPSENPQGARARMRVVLAAMVETGAITKAQAEEAARSVVIAPRPTRLPTGSYFADWMMPQARAAFEGRYGETVVRTTLDPELQAQAEKILNQFLDRDGPVLHATQGALVAMRPDGRVIAMVGGRDYKLSQFNRADGERQPGSAFKLFVYLTALRQGWTPNSPILDTPVQISGWTPKNHEGKYAGREVPLITAFAASSNAAAVRLAKIVGRDEIVRTVRSLGVNEPIPNDLTLALGTGPMSLVQLTAAYAAIAAGEGPVIPHGLADWRRRKPAVPLGKAELAGMRDLLRSATQHGTGVAAAIPGAFGKTGTTQNYRDALFIGYVDDLVVGVWVGNDDNSAMNGVVGGGLPAQIWRAFATYAVGRGAPPAPAVTDEADTPMEEDLTPVDPVSPMVELPPGAEGAPPAEGDAAIPTAPAAPAPSPPTVPPPRG